MLLFVVIAQITILDLFTLGRVGIEISLVIVIYAGFRLGSFRGGLIALMLGFFLDCLTSAIFGLYTFLYILIFYLSAIVAGRVYGEKPTLIASFTAVCTLLEGLVIILLYRFFFSADILYTLPKVFIPQAIVLGFLSPLIFRFFHNIEVFLNAEDTRPARRI